MADKKAAEAKVAEEEAAKDAKDEDRLRRQQGGLPVVLRAIVVTLHVPVYPIPTRPWCRGPHRVTIWWERRLRRHRSRDKRCRLSVASCSTRMQVSQW